MKVGILKGNACKIVAYVPKDKAIFFKFLYT